MNKDTGYLMFEWNSYCELRNATGLLEHKTFNKTQAHLDQMIELISEWIEDDWCTGAGTWRGSDACSIHPILMRQ